MEIKNILGLFVILGLMGLPFVGATPSYGIEVNAPAANTIGGPFTWRANITITGAMDGAAQNITSMNITVSNYSGTIQVCGNGSLQINDTATINCTAVTTGILDKGAAYTFTFKIYNASGTIANTTTRGYIIDNTVPAAMTSITAANTKIDLVSVSSLSGTTGGDDVVNCTLKVYGAEGTGSVLESYTVAPSSNVCTKTFSAGDLANGWYQLEWVQSDGTNTTTASKYSYEFDMLQHGTSIRQVAGDFAQQQITSNKQRMYQVGAMIIVLFGVVLTLGNRKSR